MKPRAIFLATAGICVVAAAIIYLKNPDRPALSLMWIGIAVVFGVIGIAQRAGKT